MRSIHTILLSILALSMPANAAGVGSCTTCTKDVAVSKAEVRCVLDRVTRQLSSSLDPVVVATNGCGSKISDGTRLEAVRQGRQSSRKTNGQVREPYLLTKADAQCLVQRLKSADPKASQIRIDLRTCG